MAKRTKEIKIRLTEDEHDLLLARCDESQLASWLRSLGLGERIPKKRALPTVSPELFRQIVGMGNNLNQIARSLNQNNEISPSDKAQLKLILMSMDNQLSEILERHRVNDY